jgi:alpha,alpha-trehalase
MLSNAYIFDLDGVITNTAKVHYHAWLEAISEVTNKKIILTHNEYVNHIDGKSRNVGLKSYINYKKYKFDKALIDMTLIAKDKYFRDKIEVDGVDIYEDAIALLKKLRNRNRLIGLATSSKNGLFILNILGIANIFNVIVDGNTIVKYKLKSKPAPDIFRVCAKKLKCNVNNVYIFEDSKAGIIGASKTKSKKVIGVNRNNIDNTTMKRWGANYIYNNLMYFKEL